MKNPARKKRLVNLSPKAQVKRWFQASLEVLESRLVMSYSGGTGAVVTGLVESFDRTSIVATFDGPLVATTAINISNYQVNAVGSGNLELITSTGKLNPIIAATYNNVTNQVTLSFARPLGINQFYRVKIDGQPGFGVQDILTRITNGVSSVTNQTIDGDADNTVAGDFYGLVGLGTKFRFNDASGDVASLRLAKGGRLQIWRELNGDVDQLAVTGPVSSKTVLDGSVQRSRGSDGQVVLPATMGLGTILNRLSPSSFPIQAATTSSPAPVVATTRNLPYSIQIEQVANPSVPSIQSAVSAQSGGKWLIFGGRTNGLHGFDPSGVASFPPLSQNNNIYVIDPTTGQTWTEAWTTTGVPQSVWASLASTNQEFYQKGDRLYTVGGYSSVTTGSGSDTTVTFQTYDTLSSISVQGLINAVLTQGSAVPAVKQIHDPRFEVTGGDIDSIGNRTYLVFGQDFQGGYNGTTGTSNGSQVYTDEIRSFRIIDVGQALGIADYKAQRDPVNYRRRDGNLARVILPNGKQGLEYLGGVFTVPAGGGYVNPVVISSDGTAKVDSYQQYFSQYTSPNVSLFDSKHHSTATILFGGISLYDYSFTTGTLTQDPMLPFVDDVTSLVRQSKGSAIEYIMPSQLPGFYGAAASYLASPGLPIGSKGLINLRSLKGPTTLGYIYGGIFSSVPNTTNQATQTTASSQIFRVTLISNF